MLGLVVMGICGGCLDVKERDEDKIKGMKAHVEGKCCQQRKCVPGEVRAGGAAALRKQLRLQRAYLQLPPPKTWSKTITNIM